MRHFFLLFSAVWVLGFSGCSSICKEGSGIVEERSECVEEFLNVSVQIVDKRWCKEGGYGMPKVSIYLKRDLASMIEGQVIATLGDYHFLQSCEGPMVSLEIEQFFCDVFERRESWNCVSEIIFSAKVMGAGGKVFYDRRISGVAENDFAMSERSGKSRRALDTALDDALDVMLEDPAFRKAVKKASLAYEA